MFCAGPAGQAPVDVAQFQTNPAAAPASEAASMLDANAPLIRLAVFWGGLVLFLLTGNGLDFYVFMVISLGYFYLFFPKYETWEQLVSAAVPLEKDKKSQQ